LIDAFSRAIRKPQYVLGYLPALTVPQTPTSGTCLRRDPDGPVALKLDSDVNCHMPSPFRIGYKIKVFIFIIDLFGFSRAISADRRGIEPDTYIFEVPEHEEGPLGPLRITDRRGNIRKENSVQFREQSEISNTSPNIDHCLTQNGRRRSVLARLFARRKNDSQESSLVKGSTSTDDSNHYFFI
jgi:hypothetical protein